MGCSTCGRPTGNPKYCSRSCSTTAQNNRSPRRKRTRTCADCPELVLSGSVRCRDCAIRRSEARDLGNQTLEQIHNQLNAKGKHPSWKNSVVRSHCRMVNAQRPKSCEICGYSKHVEMAHRTPLRDFPSTATLGEVNRPENVRIFCRNHHWEFDNGMLD